MPARGHLPQGDYVEPPSRDVVESFDLFRCRLCSLRVRAQLFFLHAV